MRTIIAVLIPLALAGCQTWGPTWSEASGDRYYRTELNRGPTIIERVDGGTPLPPGRNVAARFEPGRHVLTVQSVPLRPGWSGSLQYITIDAEPCKRYYINAQFDGALVPSQWKPVIDYVETIGGCVLPGAK